ncbi:DNA N(6)-methyladenine demethylase ALKBH1D-like [Bidens hawaiensis]|uniref:DNA N(6)-methyladenine demethylase ALKBH1D-like n=1 Tax=Bidens hawaiensis TaxID=980011 RepID=UPI00404A0427
MVMRAVICSGNSKIDDIPKFSRPHTVPADRPFTTILNLRLIPVLEDTEGDLINKIASFQILDFGMILLKNYISLLGQVNIVSTCQRLGGGPGGFYKPSNRYGLHMMCLGRNWDPATGYEKLCGSDGSEPPPLPVQFFYLAEAIVEEAQAHIHELPSMCPDVCDCDESSDSLTRGLPVVSISIGASAEFLYGHSRDVNKLHKVILETGDALVFGGKSRLIFHGVEKILPGPWSSSLAMEAVNLKPGRLSLTLRQF